MEEKKTIELEEMNIIIRVPKESIRLEMIASVLDEDGEILDLHKEFPVSKIHEMRNAFLDNVEDGDDYEGRFVLTSKAEEELECQ